MSAVGYRGGGRRPCLPTLQPDAFMHRIADGAAEEKGQRKDDLLYTSDTSYMYIDAGAHADAHARMRGYCTTSYM